VKSVEDALQATKDAINSGDSVMIKNKVDELTKPPIGWLKSFINQPINNNSNKTKPSSFRRWPTFKRRGCCGCGIRRKIIRHHLKTLPLILNYQIIKIMAAFYFVLELLIKLDTIIHEMFHDNNSLKSAALK
jgi:hypothetical protein